MKKAILVLVFGIICITVSACNKEYKYIYHQPKENIVCIKYVDERGQIKIAEEKYEALLTDIQNLRCRKFWNDPVVDLSTPYITIEYRDGRYETISTFLSYYCTEGKQITDWLYFDQENFSQVLYKYK